jgi:predicted porin
VPLIRYDSYETLDGSNEFDELTLNLTYYFNQNIKAYVEYWDRFDAPTSAQEDDRITLQIIAAF